MMRHWYCMVTLGLSVPLVAACGGGGGPTSPSRAQESVVVTVSDSTVISGATPTVRATFRNSVGSETSFVPAWESNNLAVATIDSDGLVTTKGFGVVTITARHPTGKSGSITLNIFPRMVAEWQIEIVRISCTTTQENWECSEGTPGGNGYLTLASQTESSATTMTVQGLVEFPSRSNNYVLEGTVDTSGRFVWKTGPDTESWDSRYSKVDGTLTVERDGVFQINEDETQLTGEYTWRSIYEGYSDPGDNGTWTNVWRIISSSRY